MKRSRASDSPSGASIAEQAGHWWAVLHDEQVSAADRQAFGEWVKRSPERVEAFLQVAQLTGALRTDGVRWPDLSTDELVRQARLAPADALPFTAADTPAHPVPPGARRFTPLRRWTLVGVAAAMIGTVGVTWLAASKSLDYRTSLGEQRSVALEDGSLITLNTTTAVEVSFSGNARVVRLLDGEALFEVAHDAARPFDVVARDAVIRAVGTRFNVDQRATRTTITVMEGKVVVRDGGSEVPVAATEKLVVGEAGRHVPERVADTAPVVSWTQRRLIFERRALGEVAAEFNRYNRQQILIDDERLRSREVTGVFKADDPDALLVFLRGLGDTHIETSSDGTSRVTGTE